MPVQMNWLYENRIVHLKFEGELSDDELKQMDDFVVDCYNTSPFPQVHVISDIRDASLPVQLKKLMRLKSARHPRRGWTMTIGILQNPAWRYIIGFVMFTFQIRHRDVAGLIEAVDMLTQVDPSLSEVTAAQPPVQRLTAG